MTTATQQDHTDQFFQLLRDEEYTALKRDIETRGIKVPIELDSEGNILDGHHRWAIAQELGVSEAQIPIVVRDDLTAEAEKIAHVLKATYFGEKASVPSPKPMATSPERTRCPVCGRDFEAYPIVKTKKIENEDRRLYGRMAIHCGWCAVVQCLMLPPLVVAHKELG